MRERAPHANAVITRGAVEAALLSETVHVVQHLGFFPHHGVSSSQPTTRCV